MAPDTRDWINANHARGGSPSRVPLVRIDDASYCGEYHLPLISNKDRLLLNEGLHRIETNETRITDINNRDRKLIMFGGLIIATTSTFGFLLGILDLLVRLKVI